MAAPITGLEPVFCEREKPNVMSDRELWACAVQVESQHGNHAPVFVAERIGALALACDVAGVAIWKEIARRLDQLGVGLGR